MLSLEQTVKHRARLNQEYKQLYKNPENEFYRMIDQTGRTVRIVLKGPIDTIYKNKEYVFQFDFPTQYPFQPPKVTCITPIIHANIYQGAVCIDVLQDRWTPVYRLHSIAIILNHLLTSPDISYKERVCSKEHAEYKHSAMRHIKTWGGRRDFMMYLAGMGLLEGMPEERYPNSKTAARETLGKHDYLWQIISYL